MGPPSRLPVDDGKLSIEFLNNPPEFLAGGLSGKYSGEKAIDFAGSDKDPGSREFVHNVDLAVNYTTSVKTDATTHARSRSHDGIFDLRLAPWLNVLQVPAHFNTTLRYWTPIMVDAKVSTGSIASDTLSANRIVFGSEYEFRVIPDTSRNTMHRITLQAQHLSDRDFKHLEYAGGVHYELMYHPFFQPLALLWKTAPDRWFGFQLTPSADVSVGRTYERRNPAAAIKPSDTVRRFSNGLTLKLDLTRFVQAEISDQYFIRGEAVDTDLFHNHFESSLTLPLSRPFANSGHSLVLSFERGNLPPFASPDVNVVKVGYKLSSTNWRGASSR